MIERWTEDDAGCLIDGHWGQYGTALMIAIAAEAGWVDDSEDSDVVDVARRHLASMGPSTEPDISDDEYQQLGWVVDEIEEWMTEHLAPFGHRFGWDDGEFFLSTDGGAIITIEATETGLEEGESWSGDDHAMHYDVTLRRADNDQRFDTRFHVGSMVGEFTAADVLSSLILDASCGDQSFESFCQELGYDEDSRKAHAVWRACQETADELPYFLDGLDWQRISDPSDITTDDETGSAWIEGDN